MKRISLFTLIAVFAFSACNSEKKPSNEIALGDTIQTASGLQYYYLKFGEGRKIQDGSEVATYLSLMVNDSVIWNTNELPDSSFNFIAGYTRLIKGFTEAYKLLREGDEIVAIMPDSLAYGANGAGDIVPPYATLVYDKFKVLKVGEPKAFLADTLLKVYETMGMEAMLEKYNSIISSKDTNNYHLQTEQLFNLNKKLNNKEMFQEAAEVAAKFAEITGDIYLNYEAVLSYEKSGQIDLAIDRLKLLIKTEPGNINFTHKLVELNKELKKK